MNRNSHRGSSATPDELRADIELTRYELGHTVEALAAKADVRARAQARAGQVRDRMRQRAARVGDRARDTAHLRRYPGDEMAAPPMAEGIPQAPAARERHEKAAALAQAARDKRVLGITAVALACAAVLAGRRHYCHHGH